MPASGRFQSRILSYLSQQRLRVGDRAARWFRHAKNAAALGAQVLLYPVYVAFQSMRLAGQQMGPAAQRVRLLLTNLRRTAQGKPALPASLPSDAPIHRTLRAIRAADLLTAQPLLPLLDGEPDLSDQRPPHPPVGLILLSPLEGQTELAARSEAALTQGEAMRLQPISGDMLAAVEIGGVASLLSDRRLVLVTTTNALIDGLSPEQQRWLQQRIIWELADFGQAQRRWLQWQPQHRLGSRTAGALGGAAGGESGGLSPQLAEFPALAASHPGWLPRMLPVPMPRETTALPMKVFYRLMSWVQTGPVAIAANLFQEAALAVYFAPIEQLLEPQPSRPAPLPGEARMPRSPHSGPKVLPKSPGEILLRLLAGQQAESAQASWAEKGAIAEAVLASAAITTGSSTTLAEADLMPDAQDVILTVSRLAVSSGDLIQQADAGTLSSTAAPDSEAATWNASAQQPYIETPATLVRYEKHPLEALLDWLDRSIVWLETRLANLWRWLQGR